MKKMLMILGFMFTSLAVWAQATFEVGLTWNPNPEDSVTAYKVYRGQAPRTYNWTNDVGLTTVTRVPGLLPGQTYYFAVTALNRAWNLESEFSNEVSYTAPIGDDVTGITGWAGKRNAGKVTITWELPPTNQYVGRWRVLWSPKNSTTVTDVWVTSPKIEFEAPDKGVAFSVFITPEGAKGLGPVQMIEVPKFPDPVLVEIEPGAVKVVFNGPTIDP